MLAAKSAIKGIIQGAVGLERYLYLHTLLEIRWFSSASSMSGLARLLGDIPSGTAVLDIGACTGATVVPIARCAPACTVVAFEPHPMNLAVLRRVVRRHRLDNVRIHDVALGAEPGRCQMVMPVSGRAALHGLAHIVHESIPWFNEGPRVEVELRTLDSFSDSLEGLRVSFVKLDVENAESFVIEGGRELLRRDRPRIYVELWNNANRTRTFRLLAELGYRGWVWEEGRFREASEDLATGLNFLFDPA